MRFYYRISDQGYPKAKLPGTNKMVCLENFITTFRGLGPITIIADRCTESTLALVNAYSHEVHQTELGNSGSMLYTLKLGRDEARANEPLYFCEDDYLHHVRAKEIIQEASVMGDYFTLYDHPDKYFGGRAETSLVKRSKHSHWRYTVSTCMTFGTNKSVLTEDFAVFEEHCQFGHPNDHFIFKSLTESNRTLAVAIPGVACHTDLTVSSQVGEVVIDEWAIEMMCEKIREELGPKIESMGEASSTLLTTLNWALSKKAWQKLIHLDALQNAVK